MKNRILPITKLFLLAMALIIFDLLISGPILRQLNLNKVLYLSLFKTTELAFGIIANLLFFHQRIHWKLNIGKKTISITSIIILILILLSVSHSQRIPLSLLNGILAAIPEEYIFRGIVLTSLLTIFKDKLTTKNVLFCMIIASFLFSICHLENLRTHSLTLTLIQVVQTFGMGLMFCSLYVRKGSLALPIFIHFAIDYSISLFNSTANNPTNPINLIIGLVLPLTTYIILAIIVLRPFHPSNWNLIDKNTLISEL